MTSSKLYTCAKETLARFIRVMPDVPFSADDIHFEFVTKDTIYERFKALCAELSPRRKVPEKHRRDLEEDLSGVAIIGKSKSAVLLRVDCELPEAEFISTIAHELAHIYCAKKEIDGDHFIDVYGTGCLIGDIEDTDGISIGYTAWSETIANYIARTIIPHDILTSEEAAGTIVCLLGELAHEREYRKYGFSRLFSYIMACVSDIDRMLTTLDSPSCLIYKNQELAAETRLMFKSVLELIYERIKSGQPWKITKDFIDDFEVRYLMFVGMNERFYKVNKL